MAKNGNYIEVYPSSSERIYEHRVVAAQMLERDLEEGEVVHHIDGNGFNNDSSNLWVFRSNSDHSRFHKTGIAIRHDDGTYTAGVKQPPNTCLICGGPTRRKYCSHECANRGHRKVERPPLDELLDLLETNSYCALGRKFGVSDNAIRKWLRAYGVEPPRRYKVKERAE